jgi:hypothetical protein
VSSSVVDGDEGLGWLSGGHTNTGGCPSLSLSPLFPPPHSPPTRSLAGIDGAYFGTTFPHLFLMTYPQAIPPAPLNVYVPRIFGFKIRRALEEGGAAPAPAAGTGTSSGPRGLTAGGAASAVRIPGPAGPAAANEAYRPAGAGSSSTAAAAAQAAAAASAAAGAASAGPAAAAAAAAAAAGAAAGAEPGSTAAARPVRRELTTVLPRDAHGRPIGRDGKTVTTGEDFFDEEDAERDALAAAAASGGGADAASSQSREGSNFRDGTADGSQGAGGSFVHVRVEQLATGPDGAGGGAEGKAGDGPEGLVGNLRRMKV